MRARSVVIAAITVASVIASPSAASAIDPQNRTEVATEFTGRVLDPMAQHGGDHGFTGNANTCTAGTLDPDFRSLMLAEVNWFRDMAGLSPVTFGSDQNAKSQAAALIMVANGSLTHSPPNDWDCWTVSGNEGASNSNIYLSWGGSGYIGDNIFGYMRDPGASNTSVGHRNWILRPTPRPFGFGAARAGTYTSTALWVTGSLSSTHRFVGWPVEGYLPYQALFPRWNLAYDGPADFSSATVSLSTGGQPIPTSIISRSSSAGMQQVVWEITDWGWLPDPLDDDVDVDVSVHGVVVAGDDMDLDYRVTIFDPEGVWNGTFRDDDTSIFEADIEWLAAAGVTKGCNPPTNDRFCPTANVTRGQMAAFIVRALGLTDPGSIDFVDDDTSEFEQDIEKLATAGITKGCNPPTNNRFCPDNKVTRGQMAAFIVRALGLTDAGSIDFIDDNTSEFEQDIEKLATAGITKGCNPPANDRFCPNDYVTRGQIAAFLRRALS